LIFVNPTNASITISRVDLTADRTKPALFRGSPAPGMVSPGTGTWTFIDGWNLRWTPAGTFTVAPHAGADFIVDARISNFAVNILNDVVTGTCVTSVGNLTAVGYKTDVYVPIGADKVATAVVAFNNAGAFPRGYVTGLTAGAPSNFTVRVSEWAGNQAIASGLQLNVTIPARFSNVSVISAPAPWTAATITQPTATTDGLVVLTTNAAITKGTSAPDVQIRATPPVSYADSVFNVQMRLNGFDTSACAGGTCPHPITSVCDGVLQVVPPTRAGIQVEFLTPALTASAPVRQADFEVDYNSVNGAGTESYSVDVFNVSTGLWETIATNVPGTSNTTVTKSFAGATVYNYLDASERMKVRFVSASSTTTRTLRIDFMGWISQKGWAVDNSNPLAADTNRGSIPRPLRTIAGAASRAAGGDAIYVTSTATPYAGNVVVDFGKNGTATCPTLLQGIPDGTGRLPAIQGSNPTSDVGIDFEGNFAKADSFEVSATQVALYSAPSTVGPVFTNNIAHVPDSNYGVLLYSASNGLVKGNRVDTTGTRAMIGIWDYAGNTNLIDANKVSGFTSSVGIWTDTSSGVQIQKNIVKGNYIGLQLSRSIGTALVYNNTLDANTYMGAYSEGATITSRNNILTNNGMGWRSNGAAVTSNYDDVFGNTANYTNVSQGPNSISANPVFVQTTDPTLATYYQLTVGSACVDTGTNVGLSFNGSAPDIGAVER
jgi:parallel beta-helix repeat protein